MSGETHISEVSDTRLTQAELLKLQATENYREWHSIVDEIMSVRNGELPCDWGTVVVKSQFLAQVSKRWKGSY